MSINNLIQFAQLATLGAIELKELNDMPTITVIEFNGQDHTIDIQSGRTLMENVLDSGVPGIDADCGGECSCATCHVIIDDAWMGKVGQPSDQEESMLDLNPDRGSNSRLSCQIQVSSEIDGIVVNLPEFQY